MTSLTVRPLTSLFLLIAACRPADAQAPMTVSVAAGMASNGSAVGLEAMMGAAGLADGAPNSFSGGLDHVPDKR